MFGLLVQSEVNMRMKCEVEGCKNHLEFEEVVGYDFTKWYCSDHHTNFQLDKIIKLLEGIRNDNNRNSRASRIRKDYS